MALSKPQTHAYTPGLRVTGYTVLRKQRRLPLPGKVHVSVGQRVTAEEIVAAAELPGDVLSVNVANKLGCLQSEVPKLVKVREGDKVRQGDILAETAGWFGHFKTSTEVPADGIIETISPVTGQVLIRLNPIPVALRAYVDGTVVEVLGEEGCVIETRGALVQGIFGLGGEAFGVLKVVAATADQPLTAKGIDAECKGCILVGGSLITREAFEAARNVGAVGIIAGGIDADEVDEILGQPLGVAITGHEEIGLTIICTEGFGPMPMAERTFRLLRERDGQRASMNGATQIRAGVIRPEVIIPALDMPDTAIVAPEQAEQGLRIGSPARVIRPPYFGAIVTVVALPEELQQIETEAKVRVLIAELPSGQRVTLPRANVELIQQ
ncbi:MAG: hypothetical protein ACUVX8_00755 [Candidatus Zipacnadales bacterium]